MENRIIHHIILRIKRYDPDTQRTWIQEYPLDVGGILRFTDLFRKINEEQDPSFAWNSSCEHGQCGTCAVKVNGKPLLACEVLVENAIAYFKTHKFTIEPISVAPVVRDLIVDFEKAYSRVEKVKPYVIKPAPKKASATGYQISPKVLERYVEATRCINCFCCATACISSHRSFLGPNAMLASIVRLMDPREEVKEERLKVLYSEEGIYRCHSSMACTFVCPKQIDVAHFIALAKAGEFEEKEIK